jgi:hypothetical protein
MPESQLIDIPPDDAERFVLAHEIAAEQRIGLRCLNKWIKSGLFPAATTNINGRRLWSRSIYLAWKADALAGKYSAVRKPVRVAGAA